MSSPFDRLVVGTLPFVPIDQRVASPLILREPLLGEHSAG